MIEIQNTYVIIAAIIFAGLLLYAFISGHRLKKVRRCMKELRNYENILKNYLKMFSERSTSTQKMEDWMNVTARYLADMIDADGVGIFLAEETLYNEDGSIKDMDEIHISGKVKYYVGGVTSTFPIALTKAFYYDWDSSDGIQIPSVQNESLLSKAFDVLLQKDTLLIRNARDSEYGHFLPELGLTSLICVPLEEEGENLHGMLIAVNTIRSNKPSFTPESVSMFRKFASSVVMANHMQNMLGVLRLQWKIRQEIEDARKWQERMLPKNIPAWGAFALHGISKPAKRLGGDFYDFIEIDNNRALVVIGDATGDDVTACFYMTTARSFIRANANPLHFTTLKDLLHKVNDNLRPKLEDFHYITMQMCLLNKRENTIEYITAGHNTNLIIFIRNHTRVVHPKGKSIGLYPNKLLDFDPFTIQFDDDMLFLMYTDGINEAKSSTGELYGDTRLETALRNAMSEKPDNSNGEQRRMSPEEFMDKLMNEVETFGNSPNPDDHDDRTLVIISHSNQKKG